MDEIITTQGPFKPEFWSRFKFEMIVSIYGKMETRLARSYTVYKFPKLNRTKPRMED